MLPDWVWNPGPPTYESGALPTALRGPAIAIYIIYIYGPFSVKTGLNDIT